MTDKNISALYLAKHPTVTVQTGIFLPACAGQEASDIHPMWNLT